LPREAFNGDWPAPKAQVLAPPSFQQAVDWLSRFTNGTKRRLVCDIETHRRLITVIGFADNEHSAISIPFIRMERPGIISSWWACDEETHLISLIRKVLHNPHIQLEGQNFLYDLQYFRRYLGVGEVPFFDTMLAHHLLYPGTPKGLDYLSSLYCEHHVYWKDEGKEWDSKHLGFDRLLQYNAVDCMRTFECATVLRRLIRTEGMSELWEWECKKAQMALEMMNRGIAIDKQKRAKFAFDLATAQAEIHRQLEIIAPRDIAHCALKGKTTKP
jgi:DNA polymerase I-like protein with 3'-5' exonuclease and polymerase domains